LRYTNSIIIIIIIISINTTLQRIRNIVPLRYINLLIYID